MDTRTLRVLEYDAVRQRLRACAACSLGKELAERLEPSIVPDEVRRLIAETTQARLMLDTTGRPPLGGVTDVRAQVMNAARGGVLGGQNLQDVSGALYASRRTRAYLSRLKEQAPLVAERAGSLGVFQEIEEAVEAALDRRGEVQDSASDQLRTIRGRIQHLQDSIAKRLETILHSSTNARLIQDPIVTIRNGRYCIPIRTEFKGEFRGLVHDSSGSGATVFMEPFAVVEVNNELREERSAEEREVRRILAALSLKVGERGEEILHTLAALAELDLIFARATLANEQKATEPVLNTKSEISLVNARHPLLEGHVVPISLRIGEDFNALIVTGPNTGGKTVSLKTVGLLALMVQSGLHLPADSHSKMAIFRQVFADIGDEQSIQQSLSTFSSHMTQIVNVLRQADNSSLVLLDELGAGTDPIEGGALAQAILTELVRRRCSAVVTTHLGQLKTFAASCPEVENACVEFDTATLRPTYRLTIGSAGSSNALEIAERLGMPSALLSDARRQLDSVSEGRYSGMLDQVRQASKDAEGRRERARWIEAEAARLKEQYEQALHRLKDEEERTGAGIGLRMKDDLERLAKVADAIHEEVRFTHKSLAHRLREVRDGLRAALDRTADLLAGHAPERPLAPGDPVYVVKMHKWGQVVRVHKARRRATVRIGELEIEMGMDELLPWGSDFNGTVSSQ